MYDIKKRNLLGKVVASLHVIEFLKHGLSHCGALFWIANGDLSTTPDNIISAKIPNTRHSSMLYNTVMAKIFNGPCGKDIKKKLSLNE